MPRCLLMAGLLLCCVFAHADVPAKLVVRGTLTDTAGQPVEGTRSLGLSLYTSPTGGTPIYTERQTVTITGGSLTVALGGAGVLDLERFADEGEMYLGVNVGDDPEMSPRVQLATVPYAAAAAHVPWEGVSGVPEEIAA